MPVPSVAGRPQQCAGRSGRHVCSLRAFDFADRCVCPTTSTVESIDVGGQTVGVDRGRPGALLAFVPDVRTIYTGDILFIRWTRSFGGPLTLDRGMRLMQDGRRRRARLAVTNRMAWRRLHYLSFVDDAAVIRSVGCRCWEAARDAAGSKLGDFAPGGVRSHRRQRRTVYRHLDPNCLAEVVDSSQDGSGNADRLIQARVFVAIGRLDLRFLATRSNSEQAAHERSRRLQC